MKYSVKGVNTYLVTIGYVPCINSCSSLCIVSKVIYIQLWSPWSCPIRFMGVYDSTRLPIPCSSKPFLTPDYTPLMLSIHVNSYVTRSFRFAFKVSCSRQILQTSFSNYMSNFLSNVTMSLSSVGLHLFSLP